MKPRRMTDLNPAAREMLSVLGLTAPGTSLTFLDNGWPGQELLKCHRHDRYVVPSIEGLRALGVSFLVEETLTLLSENGTPTYDETTVSVAEYEADPGWFHYEVLAALRADPVGEELYAGLRALYQETKATVVWLTIDA